VCVCVCVCVLQSKALFAKNNHDPNYYHNYDSYGHVCVIHHTHAISRALFVRAARVIFAHKYNV